ncbi:Apoptosis-stimulating of p53 protein 2, partial [Ophiophagus hannah]
WAEADRGGASTRQSPELRERRRFCGNRRPGSARLFGKRRDSVSLLQQVPKGKTAGRSASPGPSHWSRSRNLHTRLNAVRSQDDAAENFNYNLKVSYIDHGDYGEWQRMFLTVYLTNNEQHFTEVPVTPETTCKDVVDLCKEPSETECHLAEVWCGLGS